MPRGTLLVLVITIIVVIILAVAVILSIANNNPIDKAKEATKKNNDATLEETAKYIYNDWYQKKELNQFLNDEEKSLTAQEYIRAKLQSDYGYTLAQAEKVRVSEVDGEVSTKYSAKYITADDYGKYVTNYTTPCGIESDKEHGIGGWQIFYADDKNIYLIADDYIYKTYAPKGKLGSEIYVNSDYKLSMNNVIKDYSGKEDIALNLRKYNKKYFEKVDSTAGSNAKAIAYMLDTDVWNENFNNSLYSDFTIGGPSLELFVESYNKKFRDTKIEVEVINETENGSIKKGYMVKWDADEEYSVGISSLIRQGNSEHVINTLVKSNAMWLCSPSANAGGDIMYVGFDGTIHWNYHLGQHAGFRPLICLKSNVQLNKTSSGFEIIN